MDSSNVIPFPKKNVHIKEQPLVEDITRNIEMMRQYHIQETIATLAPMIFNQLEVAGFEISDEEETDIKDGAFIIESLRSLMCKYYGIYHPFQQIAENVFSPDQEEIGALRIADSLNLELKNSETN
jgi:hypothetical protein